ncbi:MAG: hypothetical protein QW791_06710 [Candidatus Bathyarchaeia archaeon]
MLRCPQCGSTLLYEDGCRYLADGSSIQRCLCRSCSYRFSETRKPYINTYTKSDGDAHQKAAKLLVEAQRQTEKQEAGATPTAQQDVKGKIVEYCFYMQKKGYAEATIRLHRNVLTTLIQRGSNLLDPESVKEVIAKQKWSENRKRNVVVAYDHFLRFIGLTWDKPFCKNRTQKIPFIPAERELDDLISGTGKIQGF